MENRKCVICGKIFFTNRWNRKSCSPECAKAHARNQRLMPITERECPQCHKKFAPERGRAAQIYCSLECSRKHYNEQRRKEAAEAKEFLLQAQIMAENKPAKTLAEWAKEARDCNLDYGTYRALIQSGKT